ncbi:hypothetical protein [Methanothermobacter sp.]|uniref:hypothetical protein n=1 Tax=Methanothermobacter sp. TaxID=1884223 RepID=UPI003C73DEE3
MIVTKKLCCRRYDRLDADGQNQDEKPAPGALSGAVAGLASINPAAGFLNTGAWILMDFWQP